MAKAKGSEKTGGRKKGSVNKITADIREMLNAALDEVGGQEFFIKQAKENPKAFMTLIGKLIPSAVNANIEVDKPVDINELILQAANSRLERQKTNSEPLKDCQPITGETGGESIEDLI